MSGPDKVAKRVLRQLYTSQDPLGFSIENEINVIYWNHPGKDDEGEGVIFVDVREGLSIEWWMEGIERRSALAETYRLADMISQ